MSGERERQDSEVGEDVDDGGVENTLVGLCDGVKCLNDTWFVSLLCVEV